MPNFLVSYDLHKADSTIHEDFYNALEALGWLKYSRRDGDRKVAELPETTLIIQNKSEQEATSSVQKAVVDADLKGKGASLSRCLISEYRRVSFSSDTALEANISQKLLALAIHSEIFD